MFKNYFITSWRNLVRDKSYSAFNILGLAVGMGVALLIGLWIQYQFSYDRWVPGSRQAYRLMVRSASNGETDAGIAIPLPAAATIKKDIPEIRYIAQADWMGNHSLVAGDKKLYFDGTFAGEDFLHIFPYRLLRGDATEVLKEPASIVITEATAAALFGAGWLLNYYYRISITADVFIVSAAAALLITLLTISFQAIRAGRQNPVDSLRAE
jgi:putative ABC transport system permease protein